MISSFQAVSMQPGAAWRGSVQLAAEVSPRNRLPGERHGMSSKPSAEQVLTNLEKRLEHHQE
jgi:hypothetical protein